MARHKAAAKRAQAKQPLPAKETPAVAQPAPAHRLIYKARVFGGSFAGFPMMTEFQYHPSNKAGFRFAAVSWPNITEEEMLSGIDREAVREVEFKYSEFSGITDALRLVIASRPEERRRKAP